MCKTFEYTVNTGIHKGIKYISYNSTFKFSIKGIYLTSVEVYMYNKYHYWIWLNYKLYKTHREGLLFMKTIITGKNIEVTEGLRERVEKKIGKLDKFFNNETEAHVTLSVQRTRQIAEVTISFNGIVLRAEESNEDMYTSIDKAIDLLERQIRKHKTRLERRLHDNDFRIEDLDFKEEVPEEKEFMIVRSKRFAVKPMDVEEAILQMNLLGHEFFMFYNSESKQVNVVYKRKDGNYGLIEQKF